MIEVTEKATEKLKEYLEEREIESAIRILSPKLVEGGPHWEWLWMSQTRKIRLSNLTVLPTLLIPL